MKYVRFQQFDASIRQGVLHENHIQPFEGDLYGTYRLLDERVDLPSVRLLAPCLPGKVVGVGGNYHSHLRNKGRPTPKHPKIFLKPTSSVIGIGEDILLPDREHDIVYEAELGVVIGKRCREASERNALEHVFGYTCLNDVTDYTMIDEDGIWSRSKGADTFCPIGPAIATDVNPFDTVIRAAVDGEIRQNESTSGMVFDVPALVAFISRDMTLFPGDIVATGSPAGMGRIYPGNVIDIEIEGIGTLRNRVAMAR